MSGSKSVYHLHARIAKERPPDLAVAVTTSMTGSEPSWVYTGILGLLHILEGRRVDLDVSEQESLLEDLPVGRDLVTSRTPRLRAGLS